MKVLIIDDSPEAIAVAKARLANEENLTILCADGGRRGLEALKAEKPDLVLLDVDMPDVSGFDLCRTIKSDPELCMIPIIFLTGSGGPEDKVRGLDLGAVDYISKPFDAFELRARVRAALRTKHFQDLLIEYAQIDPLTSLPNRRALQERLAQEWDRLMRHGGRIAFIMVDLDHFKRVNDTYGHSIGDRVLQQAAKVLQGQCRKVDLPARYGGEEFAIVVPEVTALEAVNLAERCRIGMENVAVKAGAETVKFTASFGVSDSDGVGSSDALIELADRALFQAKDAGRNNVRVVAADAEEAARPSLG
ncbi:MAG: diguanylate cyclase [Planctomycetota bacterium]|nr:diguanylate cyclase [Planctomycetota bacterium]